MLFNMKCPSCGAIMQFDDTKETMFCPYCGGKVTNVAEQVNINQNLNVSGTVMHVQDRSNDPNLYISYNTNNPAVGMVTRIVTTGVKNTYVNGQTQSYHLNQGPHTVVLKIGKRNYNRNIVIPPDNSPVRIYASFNGHAQIAIDQPNVPIVQNSVPVGAQTPTSVQSQTSAAPQAHVQPVQNPGKPKSPLSILSFVLSLTYYLSWAGAGLGAVETFVLDKKKEKNHVFSYIAIGIGSFLTLALIIGLGGSSKKTTETTVLPETSIVTEGVEQTTTASETQVTTTQEETTTEATTTKETSSSPTLSPTPSPSPTPTVDPKKALEEFKETTTPLDYKELARNPEKYIGQNFRCAVYVSSARTGGLFTGYQRYFITYMTDVGKARKYIKNKYSNDFSDAAFMACDTDKCVWLMDNRDTSDPSYIKILESDVLYVYGTFNGLTESTNVLTGEKSEEVSLDIKYIEVVTK